eukprot:715574-Amphidinium_carterae.1
MVAITGRRLADPCMFDCKVNAAAAKLVTRSCRAFLKHAIDLLSLSIGHPLPLRFQTFAKAGFQSRFDNVSSYLLACLDH